MKILILDTLNGSICTATHKWEISSNLVKLGHEVYVMTTTRKELNGLTAYILRTNEQRYMAKLLFKIKYIILLLLKSHYFDIMYTRNVGIGMLGLLVKRISGSKLVLELNGLFSEDWKFKKKEYGEKGKLKNMQMKIMDFEEIFVAKKVDAVITVTQGIKDILIKRGVDESKIAVIPNGANADLFRPIDDPVAINELRGQHNMDENALLVTFVGSLEPYEGVEYLIQAAPSVLKIVSNAMFLIVGDGRVKNGLMNLAGEIGVFDKFIFTGNVSYEKVPLYINMSSVGVAPFTLARNDRIGLSPLKVYEYLACGKPVVASDVKGIGELLNNTGSGILVAPEDSTELANGIIKLIKDKELREKMGKNGREMVVNNCTWEHIAKKTIEVFEKLLNKRG